jgi:hypothetical protein
MDFAMTTLNDQDIDQLARKRAARKLGWYIHAAIYVAVNGWLLLLHMGSGRHAWMPALGWGLGLAIHGLTSFLPRSGTLRERLVERERRKLQKARERAPFA